MTAISADRDQHADSPAVRYAHAPAFLEYRFTPEHPFNPERLRLTLELIQAAGLLQEGELLAPTAADDQALTAFHDPEYVAAVRRYSDNGDGSDNTREARQYGLDTADNPTFPAMHRSAAAIAGGSLALADALAAGEIDRGANFGGGLHHARAASASGFCIYNDAVLAILRLRRSGMRVAYIDTDAHHGDGVQWAFYRDPRVLTISVHESGRFLYPGTGGTGERGRGRGTGYAVNVPLAPGTGDQSVSEVLQAVLPPLVAAFSPDCIVSQHGCDGHIWDPLTHLQLTMTGYRLIPRLVRRAATEHAGGRWLALGGGGYAVRRVVPRAWAAAWSAVSERPLPERLPPAWLRRWSTTEAQGDGAPLPASFADPPDTGGVAPPDAARRNLERAERVVEQALADWS